MSTSGRDFVLLHGLFGITQDFDQFVATLEAEDGVNRVYVPPLPPLNGGSCATMDRVVKSVREYLDDNRIYSEPILIGYSLGASIAAALYTSNPTRFNNRSVLISPLYKSHPWLIPFAPFVALKGSHDNYRGYAPYRFGPAAAQYVLAMRYGVKTFLDPFMCYTVASQYPATLFITGADDRLIHARGVERYAEELKGYVSETESVVLPGSHELIFEKTPEVTSLVASFSKKRIMRYQNPYAKCPQLVI